MTKTCKHRTFNHDSGENPFNWIIEETARIRHHNQRFRDTHRMEQALKRGPLPADFKSLRGFHRGHAVHLLKRDEPGLQASGEHTFEIAKARKL